MRKLCKILGAIICMSTIFTAAACGNNKKPPKSATPNCNIEYAVYDVKDVNDDAAYQSAVSTNLPTEDGVILSPYYTMKLNGKDVPVYASRTASGIHSFAMIDVEEIDSSKPFYIDAEITARELSNHLSGYKPEVVVLPESTGVTAEISNGNGNATAKARITAYGSYSFAFDKTPEEALTLMIAKKEDTSKLFENYTVKYIEPGDYSEDVSATTFSEPNTVYYFKAGKYKTDSIRLSSDTMLYLDRNAYIEVMPAKSGAGTNAIYAKGNNIKVAGRGLLDFSACCGGEVPVGYYNNKGGINFDCVYNASFSGITIINSQTWTLCMNACVGVEVNTCMFFAYRVFADGIMLSDCQDAVVEYNFIHTGDDAFETKSTTSQGRQTKNVIFRYNAAWTDKAVAYGCIYESNYDTQDVRFEDNSVGFATGTWSNHLGCCVIQMGNRKGATMKNIVFKNMEVYFSQTPGLLNVYIGGSGGRGEGYGIVKNIFFKNVTAKINYGKMLHLQTYDSENCFIYDLYLDNIVANGTKLTKENMKDNVDYKYVAGGYDADRYLHINTKSN